MTYKALDDLSVLTTVPLSNIKTLSKDLCYVCGHDVFENKSNVDDYGESVTSINIGIGTLSIKWNGSEVKYKFVPSSTLSSCISDACVGNDPLTKKLEESFKSHILSSYKELF